MGISIHALREEGDGRLRYFGHQAEIISIHALREEGDYTVQIVHVGAVISIHALREEGDGSFSQFILDLDTFLSTPSARRATNGSSRCRPA